MKVVRVNATTDIELHDRFINIVSGSKDSTFAYTDVLGNRRYYEPTDKRDIWNVCKIDHKETMLLGGPTANEERAILEFKLTIIGRDQRPIKELDFINKEDRDLVYEELKKDILSKTK